MSLPVVLALLVSATLFAGYLYLFLSPLIRDPSIVAPYSTQKALRHHRRNKRTGYINGWLSTSRSGSRTTQRAERSARTPSSESRSDLESAAGHAYSDDSQHTATTTTSQTHGSGSTTLHPPHPFRQYHHLAPSGTAARYPGALPGSPVGVGAGIIGSGRMGSRGRIPAVGGGGRRPEPRPLARPLTRSFSTSPVAVRVTTSNSSSTTSSGSLLSPPPPAYVSHPNTPTAPDYDRGGWSSPTISLSGAGAGDGGRLESPGLGSPPPPLGSDSHHSQYSSINGVRNVSGTSSASRYSQRSPSPSHSVSFSPLLSAPYRYGPPSPIHRSLTLPLLPTPTPATVREGGRRTTPSPPPSTPTSSTSHSNSTFANSLDFPAVPNAILSPGSTPPAPSSPIIGQSRSYPPPSPSSRVARSLGPPPPPSRVLMGPGREPDMQMAVPSGPRSQPLRTPQSPRARESPAVHSSSYLAVPVGTGPGYDAVRAGGGGVGGVVDRSGDETERPISMTSTNASEGSCYSTITLISSPPSPQPRGSPSLPVLAPYIPQAPGSPSLAHPPTTIVDNTPDRTSRLPASSSFPPPPLRNSIPSHGFMNGWKEVTLPGHPSTSFPPSSSLPSITPSPNSMPRLGGHLLPQFSEVPQHQAIPVPLSLPRVKPIVALHLYPSSSKT